MSGNGISWAICKSAPRSREIGLTTLAPHHSAQFFLTGRMPSLPPNQQSQSTEGRNSTTKHTEFELSVTCCMNIRWRKASRELPSGWRCRAGLPCIHVGTNVLTKTSAKSWLLPMSVDTRTRVRLQNCYRAIFKLGFTRHPTSMPTVNLYNLYSVLLGHTASKDAAYFYRCHSAVFCSAIGHIASSFLLGTRWPKQKWLNWSRGCRAAEARLWPRNPVSDTVKSVHPCVPHLNVKYRAHRWSVQTWLRLMRAQNPWSISPMERGTSEGAYAWSPWTTFCTY